MTDRGRRVYTSPVSTIGVWTTASRQKTLIYGKDATHAGPWTQISRLGNPLMNEVIIPMGMKDYWNTQAPVGDAAFSGYYDHPTLAALSTSCTPERSPISPLTRPIPRTPAPTSTPFF